MSRYSTYILSTVNPLGYWRLGERTGLAAYDSTVNGNTGVISGGVTLGQTGMVANDPNTSMLFNGSTGVVTLPLVTFGVANILLEAWVTLPTSTSHGAIIKIGGATSGWGIGIGGTTFDNAGTQIIGELWGIAWVPSGISLSVGVKHLVSMVIVGSSWYFFVDGALVSTQTQSVASAVTPASNCSIGNDPAFAGRFLNATIDEVYFDDVTALSLDQIKAQVQADYQAGQSSSRSFEDLTVYKRQVVRVFSPNGSYLGIWGDAPLLSGFKETINGGTTALTVSLPRTFDNFNGCDPSSSGPVDTIAQGNVVQYTLYGPGLPQNGLLRYQGVIDKWEPSIDSQGAENIVVTITPFASILVDHGAQVAVTLTNMDPLAMFDYWFTATDPITGLPYAYPLTLDPNNPTTSGRDLTYTFTNQPLLTQFASILLMLPTSQWFYRVNTDKSVTRTTAPLSAQHVLYLGSHLTQPKYSQDWTAMKTAVVLNGKSGVSSTVVSSNIDVFGERLYWKSDNRLTDVPTCNAIAQGILNLYDAPLLRAPLRIFDYRGDISSGLGYDIETLKVGDTIQIIDTTSNQSSTLWDQFEWDVDNWGGSSSVFFSEVVVISELTYGFDYVDLQVGSAAPNQAQALYRAQAEYRDFTMAS